MSTYYSLIKTHCAHYTLFLDKIHSGIVNFVFHLTFPTFSRTKRCTKLKRFSGSEMRDLRFLKIVFLIWSKSNLVFKFPLIPPLPSPPPSKKKAKQINQENKHIKKQPNEKKKQKNSQTFRNSFSSCLLRGFDLRSIDLSPIPKSFALPFWETFALSKTIYICDDQRIVRLKLITWIGFEGPSLELRLIFHWYVQLLAICG